MAYESDWKCGRCNFVFTERKKIPCPECGSYNVKNVLPANIESDLDAVAEGTYVPPALPELDHDYATEEFVELIVGRMERMLTPLVEGDMPVDHVFDVIDGVLRERGSVACPRCRSFIMLEHEVLGPCECWDGEHRG